MQDIYLTIIVPVYNVERYLRTCLDSIAQLKAFSWEAILVDDGSTDTSGKICDKYAKQDSRFRVIHRFITDGKWRITVRIVLTLGH